MQLKQVYLLNNFEEVLNILYREAEIYEREALLSTGIERLVLKSIRNKILEYAMTMQLSNCVKDVFGKKVAITDVDCVLYANGRIRAIIEMKRRVEDFKKYIMANAKQFFILRSFARKFDVPLIYMFKIGDGYRILEVDTKEFVEVKRLGRGQARDNYAVWEVEKSIYTKDIQELMKGWIQ